MSIVKKRRTTTKKTIKKTVTSIAKTKAFATLKKAVAGVKKFAKTKEGRELIVKLLLSV